MQQHATQISWIPSSTNEIYTKSKDFRTVLEIVGQPATMPKQDMQ